MKQTHGFRKEVKRRVETDSETIDETLDETDDKQNEKDNLGPVISMENRIVTASKYASGAVLTQIDINGDRHPVAFLSKTFMDTEQQYEIYDRELFGIVQALKEWRHYIQGLGHMTLVHTDHWNLTYFRKAQKLSDRQARWSLFIFEFDIKLQHLPGNKIVLSNTLSRRPDHCPEEDETKEEILLPDDLFLNLLDINLRDRITRNKEYNFDVTKAIELLQEEGLLRFLLCYFTFYTPFSFLKPCLHNSLDSWT
jgi:hypothetical protein